MHGPVGAGVVARGDEDGVPLRDGEGEKVNWRLLDIGTVDLNKSVQLPSTEEKIQQTSITRISWPSIQKKNMAKADVFTTRKR